MDGRKIDFNWLKLVWQNQCEWPNVTKGFPILSKLEADVGHKISEQAKLHLALCIFFHINEHPKPSC